MIEISQNVFDKLVYEVTEAVLLRIPEVLGNLMRNHAEINILTKEFYKDNPEFKNSPEIVSIVMNHLEKKNPGIVYNDLIKKAVPQIKEQIRLTKGLDVTKVTERSNLDLNIDLSLNGEL